MADLSVYGKINTLGQYMQAQQKENAAQQMAQDEMALKRQQFEQSALGTTPAAVKVAQEIRSSLDKRDAALSSGNQKEAQYWNDYANLVNTSNKSLDKGINAYNLPAYEMPQTGAIGGKIRGSEAPMYTPPQSPEAPIDMGEYGDGMGTIPLTPSSYNVQPIAGYGESVGSIAATKKGMEEQAKSNVELAMQPTIEERKSAAKETGKARGEKQVLLADVESNLPELTATLGDLSKLSDTATYTKAGQFSDSILKQLGTATQGATDAAQYSAIVDNTVLPLLKQTFGAAFTVQEGDSLRATLGDPNATPAAKKAKLDAFIQQKYRTIRSAQRYLGAPVSNAEAPTFSNPPEIQSVQTPQFEAPKKGTVKNGYIFNGGNPADPKSWKKQ